MLQHTVSSRAHSNGPATPLGLVDADGVAELLRVSRRTLDRIIRKDKKFPKMFRIGAHQYMRMTDLQRWAEEKALAA